MSVYKEIKYKFTKLSILEKLIIVNIFIFILNLMIPFLFKLNRDIFTNWVKLPEDLGAFIKQPWSIITYSFFHSDGYPGRFSFMHIFWNMILLYLSGRTFLNLFGAKRFINAYFMGVIAGGLVFLLSYNLFPVFFKDSSGLIGASAGVMSILIFVCSYIPDQEVRIIFFNIKLWYIGAFLVLMDLVQMTYDGNAGGHLAHLGGASLGFMYARNLKQGKDIGSGFEKMISWIVNIFKSNKKSPLKTVYKKKRSQEKSSKPPLRNSIHQKQIDDILDKISKSGYESLSKEEKDFLFKAGKK